MGAADQVSLLRRFKVHPRQHRARVSPSALNLRTITPECRRFDFACLFYGVLTALTGLLLPGLFAGAGLFAGSGLVFPGGLLGGMLLLFVPGLDGLPGGTFGPAGLGP